MALGYLKNERRLARLLLANCKKKEEEEEKNMKKRPRSSHKIIIIVVECGMNIQTAKRLHQKTFTEGTIIKELFVSKALEEDIEYPKC